MKKIVEIKKNQNDPDVLVYTVGSHKIVIYKVQSSMPHFPWRVSIDDELQKTHFSYYNSAETFMISHLSGLDEYSNNIFTIVGTESKSLQNICDCGKEKHKFFSHSNWCSTITKKVS